ncbi:MAG TPA: hypothetical protein VK917_01990 [Ilumatobacter sp.]|nr:hypothetical protein [Ilumatobacter sp.]
MTDGHVHVGARTAPHIGVALSGGGHRATLFGLGAMAYLLDAGYPLLEVPSHDRARGWVS